MPTRPFHVTLVDSDGKSLAESIYDLDPENDMLENILILASMELDVDSDLLVLRVGSDEYGLTEANQAVGNVIHEGCGPVTVGLPGRKRTSSAPSPEGSPLRKESKTSPLQQRPSASSVQPAVPKSKVEQQLLSLFGQGRASSGTLQPVVAAAAVAPGETQQQSADDYFMSSEEMELQRKLYEAIQQREIDNTLAAAMEYTPEAFARVTMLYISCKVNKVPIKAFVDSGAQVSIMSAAAAAKCNLERFIDRRIQGVAKGVGTQKIMGIIHMTEVEIDGQFLPFSFHVLEDPQMDVIVGLDQLKRHAMVLDLSDNTLKFGSHSVSFLGEADLPDYAKLSSDFTMPPDDDKTGSGDAACATAHQKKQPPQPKPSTATHHDPMASLPATSTPSGTSNNVVTESQRLAVSELMELTGIGNERIARGLLEAAGWNVEQAATIFYDELEQ